MLNGQNSTQIDATIGGIVPPIDIDKLWRTIVVENMTIASINLAVFGAPNVAMNFSGVVNRITKKNEADGTISISFTMDNPISEE